MPEPVSREIPAPFPGFTEYTKSVARDIRAAEKRLQEAETALVSHGKSPFRPTVPPPPPAGVKPESYRILGFEKTYTQEEYMRRPEMVEWQTRQDELLAAQRDATRQLGRAMWFNDFYALAPQLVTAGAVGNLDDYLTLMKLDPIGILSKEDRAAAEDVLARMTGVRGATVREDAPEWLQVTPEQEEALREAFALRPPVIPATVHRITTNAILTSLIQERQPPMQLPEEWTPEQLLQYASIMDIPEEELTRATEFTELLESYADAASEREARIKAVLAGEEEWEMPEMGLWQRAMFTVLSPMQTAADLIKPYIEHVSYPIAGFAAYQVARFLSGTQEIEDQYTKMKALGYNWWDAMSEAYQEWSLPWYLKLGLEIVTDPITWIPGLGLSIPGKVLTRIPTTATRTLGGGFVALNKGLWRVTDIPFDAFKAVWSHLPKTFNQATKMELNAFRDTLIAAASKQSGHIVSDLTPVDLAQTLERSVKAFIENPKLQGDAFVDLGELLIRHAPLDETAIRIWSRSLGGKLDDVTPTILESVEDTISDAIFRMGSPAENAKRIAIALAIEDTPQIIGKIIKDLAAITTKYSSRVPRAIEIGRQATVAPTVRMMDYLVTTQKSIIQAMERSSYAKGKAFSGMILGLMNKVDKLERGAWRMTLDRWLVRPMAEAYLGSVAYPIWNVFEGVFVSALEGVVPRMAKQEAFQRMFLGMRGVDNRVMQWSASDVAGMLGTMPGREGSISLLPGKVPKKILGLKTPKWIAGKDWFEWTGRKWIELSDVWGTGLRANFLMRKMAHYLAEYSYQVAGQDLNAAFTRLVKRSFPKNSISKKTLGLSDHELRQEMFERLATGLKSEVLGMKELLTNSSLMRGEALKILRQATEISPQAKTLGEQMIAKGTLKTNEDVVGFCKTLADQSVADLKAFSIQSPDAFRFMADQIEVQKIDAAEDLMQIFQHYEVMADTASRVSTKLLSQVFDEADELKRLGKFNKLETLWRTSRADVENVVDSVGESLNRVKAVVQGKSHLLTTKQQNALNTLLERQTARTQLQEQFLRADGRLLDDFWALPKAMRTGEEHAALRAYRLENIIKFKGGDAVLGAGDFLERKSYSQLYYNLPKPKLFRIDASARALSADDCAKAMGCNVDALTTGLMESMTFQDKPYFIQMIKQSADAHPTYYKGFTEEKIGQVYDDIIRGLRMSPEADIMTQKILQQVEGVKQRLITLRMTKSLSPSEEKALHAWIDDVAEGMDEIFGKEVPAVPAIDVGLTERFATPEDIAKLDKEVQRQIKDFDMTPAQAEEWVFGAEGRQAVVEGKAAVTIPGDADKLKETLTELAQAVKVPRMFEARFTEIRGRLAKVRGLREAWDKIETPKMRLTFDELLERKIDPDALSEALDVFRWRGEGNVILSEVKKIQDDLLDALAVPDTMEGYIAKWFSRSENKDLQAIGDLAVSNKEYLGKIHTLLRDQYGDFIKVSRGKGMARHRFLEREYTNVTSSKRVAQMFDDTWVMEGKAPTQVDDVLVKVDDIVAIGAVDESELIIPAKVLRDRIDHPLKPPTVLRGGIVTKEAWDEVRQRASESAHKEYYKAFADYTNENIIDAVGKSIYPFWTYHMYRWFFLTRTFTRKPGTMAAWGKYYEYSDYGNVHIPGTDLEFNPAIGSAFGATFSLARHDFKSYYENLGFAGEILDFTQRRGWFPGIHITAPIALTSIFSDRPPELGEVLAPIQRVGLNLLVNSKIPVVASTAKWLKDRVFHENFHDYYTATIVSSKQVEAGGTLIGGQAGVDLWFKQMRDEELTEEEQRIWDAAYEEAAWLGVLRSEFPGFRLRAEEMLEAYAQVSSLIEAQTGMSADMQDDLWRHNLRPTDAIGGLPLDLRTALDEMWQWRIYFGRGAILMPPEYSDLYNLMDKYYGKVENYQIERLALQTDVNRGFLYPTDELHFSGKEWRREYANNWSSYSSRVDSLEKDPEFADAIDAMTPEGQIRLAKELGSSPPPIDPMLEAIRLYFGIELQKKKDPYTGEEDYDYLRFWLERESVRMVLSEEQRASFDTRIRRYQTPMEVTFKEVTNKYLRGYRAIPRIVLEEFTDEEKALIAEYHADATTRERKLEITEFISHSGRKLISYWNSRRTDVRAALRKASPDLDFWLYVFGYIDEPKTDTAKAMVKEWESDKGSIVRGVTETSLLEEVLRKVEEKEAKRVEK